MEFKRRNSIVPPEQTIANLKRVWVEIDKKVNKGN